MWKAQSKSRILIAGLLTLVLLVACRMRAGRPPQTPVEEANSTATEEPVELVPTSTELAITSTSMPTATQRTVTPTSSAKVMVTAIKGNLFIRRGPDLAYNPIGVLVENSTAEVVARDVLSKWAQIVIPNSDKVGWVSLQSHYTQVQGNLQALPDLTPTDWPLPAYVRNCTFHQMIVKPGDVIVPSLLEAPENEVWIYPGSYTVYDLDHPDIPEVRNIEIREGLSIDIIVDGNGEKRKCP